MAQIGLWAFDDAGTTLEDSATDDGAQSGSYQNGASASGGTATFDGNNDYAEIPGNPAFQLTTGTLVMAFNPDSLQDATVFSRASQGFDDGGHFELRVYLDGSIGYHAQTDSADVAADTPAGFYAAGDDIRVTYSWNGDGTGGTFKVENLTQSTTHSEPVPGTLTWDQGSTSEPIVIGASQANSDDNTANNLDQFFDGSMDYVSLFDEVVDPGGPTLDIIGTAGNDTLTGTSVGEVIQGQGGNDTLYGNDGDDTLIGGDGNDQIFGGRGADVVDGGDGLDWVRYDGGSDQDMLINLTTGTGTGGDAQGDTYTSIEYVWADGGDDTIIGDGANNTLRGDAGDDSISAGSGWDIVVGGAGADTLDGGDGVDSLFYFTDTVGVNVDLGAGTASGGEAQGDIFSNFENVRGGSGGDRLTGDAAGNSLQGAAGNDSLFGSGGNDSLSGDGGDDLLDGGEGADRLSGGAGSDTFIGGIGDTINGGESAGDNDVLDLRNTAPIGWRIKVDFDASDAENGTVEYRDEFGVLQGTSTFTNIETVIPCFTRGAMIATSNGSIPVEHLRVGDLVQTADNGLQPIRWIGLRRLNQADLNARPNLRPVLLQPGCLGNSRPLLVSPQHRFVTQDPGLAEKLATDELFIRAKFLTETPRFKARIAHGKRSVTYIHLMFDRHQVIFADGVATESLYPGPQMLRSLDADALAELQEIFPDIPPSVSGEKRAELPAQTQWYGDMARRDVLRSDMHALCGAGG